MESVQQGSPNRLISKRKSEHIALCASGEVEFQAKSTLLDQIQLIHEALPDQHLDDINLETPLLGRTLRAPIVISAMTGGTSEAEQINRDLASVAERLGLGFGLGSQRAMLVRPETRRTYQVRDVAPNVLLLGNLGLVQATTMSTSELARTLDDVGADALCLHLNPAMELIQPGGDRDFRNGLATIARIRKELDLPLVVKETGCGLSRRTGVALRDVGVEAIDVSGAGGTSWVGVETKRAEGDARALGENLWDWGIPTAASIAANADLGFQIIATGGLRTGLDAAHALALGAHAAGYAAPVLRAYKQGGVEAASSFLTSLITVLRAVILLTGANRPRDLSALPRVVSPVLGSWIAACGGSAPGR